MTALVAGLALGDDIGITNARLLEDDDGVYVLEVEAHPNIVGWITPPVFPERFEVRDAPEPEWNGSIVTVRFILAAPSGGLRAGDVVILPWQRSAALITVKWSDGTVRRGLFTRGIGGIRVPISELRDDRPTAIEVAARNFRSAVVPDGGTWGVIALLAAAIALAATPGTLGRRLAALAGGLAVAMVATDVGLPAIPESLGVGGVCLGAVLLARIAARGESLAATGLCGAVGLVAGLGIATALGDGPDRIAALFGRQIAVAGLTMLAAVALYLALRPAADRLRKVAAYAVGSLGVAATMFVVAVPPAAEAGASLDPGFELGRSTEPGVGVTSLPPTRPPSAPEDPVTLFVTVEPFEVRVEALVRVADWIEDRDVLAIDDQDAVAGDLLAMILRSCSVSIDGAAATPDTVRTDYVAIGPFGVQTRAEAIDEPVADAVVGVTLAFAPGRLPTEVEIAWTRFDAPVTRVPSTWSDPGSVGATVLTPESPSLAWRGDVAAFAPPAVEAIEVEPARWPALSIALAGLGLLGLLASRRRRGARVAAWIVLAVAVLTYPFARPAIAFPGWTASTPDAVTASRIARPLLTNVYRAFDVRAEDAIYDRLAISVTGGQLTDAYLEHRRALELENRGGARARVDDVDVLRVRSVRPVADGGFTADVSWTVSGSVGHFGHIHYRRNRYRADLTIVPVDGAWKLAGVEIRDEQRIL